MNEDLRFKLELAKKRAMKHDEADTPIFKPITEERVKGIGRIASRSLDLPPVV